MVAKREAKRVIDALPDDAPVYQIVYALYVNMMLDEGERWTALRVVRRMYAPWMGESRS